MGTPDFVATLSLIGLAGILSGLAILASSWNEIGNPGKFDAGLFLLLGGIVSVLSAVSIA